MALSYEYQTSQISMQIQNIHAFVPAKDYDVSKSFYTSLGFSAEPAGEDLTLFSLGDCTFFLYKDENTSHPACVMLQMIVSDIQDAFDLVSGLNFQNVRHSGIKNERWGKVIYLWGPSDELWHITQLHALSES